MTSTSDTNERDEQQAASGGLLGRVGRFFGRLFGASRPAPATAPPDETVEAADTAAEPIPAEPAVEETLEPEAEPEAPPVPKERPPGVGPKYAPLYHHLSEVEGDVWKTTFSEIRSILGNPLPRSALIYPAWWANTGKSQSNAWLKAGWSTQEVNLHSATLTFFRSGGLPKAEDEAAEGEEGEAVSQDTDAAKEAPPNPLTSGEEGRSDADRIRLFTFATVIAPAREAGQETVAVRAGDIHKEIGLKNRYASVVNALRSKKFAALANVTIVGQEGARIGASTVFTFALTDAAASGDVTPVAPSAPSPVWPEREPAAAKEPSVVPEAPAFANAPTPTPPAADSGTAATPPPTPTYSGPPRTVVVIQGGEERAADAGHMVLPDGRRVVFVAEPGVAPSDPDIAYRRPDDRADGIQTFRDALVAYNGTPEDNPLGLLPAWRLYEDDAYRALAEEVGVENVFILSAGWGIIESGFLTPAYEITFSNGVATYKRRRPRDSYNDFRRLPSEGISRLVFAGGPDYIPLFLDLTEGTAAERVVYHHASRVPLAADNARFVPIESDDVNDWHLQWAKDYATGNANLP